MHSFRVESVDHSHDDNSNLINSNDVKNEIISKTILVNVDLCESVVPIKTPMHVN